MTAEAHAHESSGNRRIPQDVIVDTDIGTDVDDAYAVLLAISSPELNVKGFTLVHADLLTRAKIMAKLLRLAGRLDIPFFRGESQPINRERRVYWRGHEGRGIDFSDVEFLTGSDAGVHAAEFIATAAAEKPGEVLLITVGPLTNAAIAIRDYPREMACLKGIVCMGSTFNGFGPENAGAEHNIAVDPEAAEIVLGSGMPVFVVGLNVSMQTALTGSRLAQISSAGTPLADYMTRMTEDWLAVIGRDSTAMHDPLAVAASFDSGIVTRISVTAEVSTETPGLVTYYEAGPDSPISISTSVDVARFHEMFYARILDAVGRL